MTSQTVRRGVNGFELECPKIETYLWTVASALQATNDPALKDLANEILWHYKVFRASIDSALQEAKQYLDVVGSERHS